MKSREVIEKYTARNNSWALRNVAINLTRQLYHQAKPMSNFIEELKLQRGIFAVFFIGDNFPLKGAKSYVRLHPLIHVNRFDEKNREVMFNNGVSDIPVLKRYLGALLKKDLDLKVIPNNHYNDKRKFSYFVFDERSDKKLTDWMIKNLSISFINSQYSYDKIISIIEIIVDQVKPILNFSFKNDFKVFKSDIDQYRKICLKEVENAGN